MKILNYSLKLFLVIFLATVLSDCDIIFPGDECDETVRPEIEAGIRATVHVLDADRNPIANQELYLSLYKKPCGADTKGRFEFNGPTNADGIRETTVAYYNLRNSEDLVYVDAYAVGLGNGSAEADGELISYKYDDFIVGTVKHVDVYIYRNF